GQGVAFRVRSPALDDIRATIATHFHGALTAQDSAGWRGHVTIQNKVRPTEAKALLDQLLKEFRPRRLGLAALALHRYLGGPWQRLGRFAFRGT
ncbi:MAG: 2'-5' RNA ligase family protein, partial [Sphingomicrobium sp.]